MLIILSCSTKKNTTVNRAYHSINTRYNIHFNANEAYKEALKAKQKDADDNLSELLNIYPDNSDTTEMKKSGSFGTTIDKCTKAIKLHSIKAKPSRDANRKNDAKYQAWLKQQEFTPFMDKVWSLLAKSELHEANYLQAISTFMYITKIYNSNPEIVFESRLYIARAYSEMGWIYEAGDVLYKLELTGNIPEKHKGLYNAVKANYLVRNNEYSAAIPFLELALKGEKNKIEKTRMKYLLGQLYTLTGDKTKAYEAFASVKGMNTPHKYIFNAQLRQLELAPLSGKESILKLEKMAKSSKNEEYRDQIYYTIGNIYLNQTDTINAIDNYRKSIEKSTRNGYDQTLSQITLADLYFDQHYFIKAQPYYSAALGQLKKSNESYSRVSLRSEVLDELVVHAKTVYEQDSLQHLAQLPEDERMQIIAQKIADIQKEEEGKKKDEELAKKQEEREERISSWADMEREAMLGVEQPTTSQPQMNLGKDNTNTFYFYNTQVVEQGKKGFQKQWGNRKPEDDWRRKNKSTSTFDDNNLLTDNQNSKDEIDDVVNQEAQQETDIYNPEYYIQQLPLTEEKIKESNELIDAGLFNMGKIYREKLGDSELAIGAFTADLKRFPETSNREEIYYQLFLIYMQKADNRMMAMYRDKVINELPDSKYAAPLSDPNYQWNFKHFAMLQDSIYDATYNAYLKQNVNEVRKNYKDFESKYPIGNLMPKFAFLNALTYAQTHDAKNLDQSLKKVVDDYPKSDVVPLATDILGRIKDGQILLSDGSPIRSFDWSDAFGTDSIAKDESGKVLAYTKDLDAEYVLLFLFKPKSIDKNELLYDVADYNFSNYIVHTFDLNYKSDNFSEALEIKGFKDFSTIKSYVDKAFSSDGLFTKIDTNIIILPISMENYSSVYPRLGTDRYITFFNNEYEDQLYELISYWKDKKTFEKIEELAHHVEPKVNDTVIETINEDKIVPAPKEKIEQIVPTHPRETGGEDKRELTGDDLFTKGQLEKIGQVNEAIETVGNIINNPVDGIKSIFKKYNDRKNLTKEEREELKKEEKEEKLRMKELRAIQKVKQDSIIKTEKAKQDSIDTIEREKLEKVEAESKAKKDADKAILKEKEDAKKQKDTDRKDKLRLQEEKRKLKEKEQKEKLRIREMQRKQKEKEAKEKLKEKQKNRKK